MTDNAWLLVFVMIAAPLFAAPVAIAWFDGGLGTRRRKRVPDSSDEALDRAIRKACENPRLTAEGARRVFADWKPL